MPGVDALKSVVAGVIALMPAVVVLKDVEVEVMALMVEPSLWVLVVPAAIVDRHPHFLRIAVVEIIGTLHVAIGIVILRIEDVGVVVESIPVGRGSRLAPLSAVGLLAGDWLSFYGSRGQEESRRNHSGRSGICIPFHQMVPPEQ